MHGNHGLFRYRLKNLRISKLLFSSTGIFYYYIVSLFNENNIAIIAHYVSFLSEPIDLFVQQSIVFGKLCLFFFVRVHQGDILLFFWLLVAQLQSQRFFCTIFLGKNDIGWGKLTFYIFFGPTFHIRNFQATRAVFVKWSQNQITIITFTLAWEYWILHVWIYLIHNYSLSIINRYFWNKNKLSLQFVRLVDSKEPTGTHSETTATLHSVVHTHIATGIQKHKHLHYGDMRIPLVCV